MSITVKIDIIGDEANIEVACEASQVHEQIQAIKTLGTAQQMILDRVMEQAFGMSFDFKIERDDRGK